MNEFVLNYSILPHRPPKGASKRANSGEKGGKKSTTRTLGSSLLCVSVSCACVRPLSGCLLCPTFRCLVVCGQAAVWCVRRPSIQRSYQIATSPEETRQVVARLLISFLLFPSPTSSALQQRVCVCGQLSNRCPERLTHAQQEEPSSPSPQKE